MKVMMKNFPETIDSRVWGLSVFSFGEMTIPAKSSYPLQEYSKEHVNFWQRGRVLDQLFLVYISKGRGEARFGEGLVEPISAGTLLILYPGIRHRYRPDSTSGWTETWLGLKGHYVQSLLQYYMVFGKNPIVNFESPSDIEDPLQRIKKIFIEEKIGYQTEAIGLVISILSRLYQHGKQEISNSSRIEKIIVEARARIQNLPMDAPLDVRSLAFDLNVSYSWFRKMYKQYTGCSPVQYRILLNIELASELLVRSHLTIKEIAFKTGFESEAYFCRQFKQKQGMSPTEFRIRN